MKFKHGEHKRNLAYNIEGGWGGGIRPCVLGTWIYEGVQLERKGWIGFNQLLICIRRFLHFHPNFQGYQHVSEHIVTDH